MLNIKPSIKDNFAVQGVVKPGASMNILVNSAIQEINGLSKKDMVVICGGTKDISINNSTRALYQIKDFMANNTHTNITVVTAPPRHDLMRYSYVNSAVTFFNRKLKEMVKAHQHAYLLEVDTNRTVYTTHGVHLNGQGKERLANQLLSHILTVLGKKEGPLTRDHHPVHREIVRYPEEVRDKLNCSPEVTNTTGTDCLVHQQHDKQEKTNSEITTIGAELNRNAAEEAISSTESTRSSSRTKKTPTTRSQDFLWEM